MSLLRSFLLLSLFFIISAEGFSKDSGNKKHIRSEKTYKGSTKDKKKVLDFDAIDIGGTRRTPLGSMINQNKADKNFDFVKIRKNWHPEMVDSAQNLEDGR